MLADISSKVIYVIGTTAVGKSKLAMDIAKHFNGEIVSADSMQIYKKASLMTAKPSIQDMLEIPHHLVDFVPISEKQFTVCEYQNLALNAIQEIQKRGRLPVVVGGTMYYVESLLYDRPFIKENYDLDSFENDTTEELYRKLEEADPEHAKKLAPQDRRRIRNALNYIFSSGKLYSEKNTVSKIRFPESIIIWLKCDKKILEQRARARIESMIKEGGTQEIIEILNECATNDYTRGVLQSIGYKEFEPLLTEGENSLPKCIDNLLLATLQYSKKQLKWIKNRFQPYLNMNIIDTTSFSNWEEITQQGIEIVQSSQGIGNKEIILDKKESFWCEACNVKIFGSEKYEIHLQTRKHRNNTRKETEDDEEIRVCDICNKSAKGLRQWEFHINSKKHKREVKKNHCE
ncbi:unnamed protein product [Blepharisma stoltei]|uniref:U1-type domain-containing protein n=1 Tax=Blepharisma stoltei TaxID=1481888 RepID=A0AAU9JFT8_9CILI|nr:unnamed protein product [Blepharisma stoltei]